MNQKKMGAFIKTLRKDKNLTQEQLAEVLGVSNRTVSRWETGSNIPDLDMLIILSDYFDVEIKDLIDGEKSVEQKSNTENDNLKAVADYNKDREKNLIRKIYYACLYGIVSWIVSFIFSVRITNEANSGWILVLFEAIIILIYGIIMLIFRFNRTTEGFLSVIIDIGSAMTIINFDLLVMFFKSGSYYNYGLVGAYYAFLLVILIFTLTGVLTCIKNRKAYYRKQKN